MKDKASGILLWSGIGIMFGFLVMIAGAILHSQYKLGSSYDTALHAHVAPGLIIVVGLAISVLGMIGVVISLF